MPVVPGVSRDNAPELFVIECRDTSQGLVDKLHGYLLANRGWVARGQLRQALGMSDREIRLARSKSRGQIIMGQNGYKATKHATLEEVQRCAKTLYGMGIDHMHGAAEYWKVIHGRGTK